MVLSSSIGYAQPDRKALEQAYIGQIVKDLPTPACILNRTKVKDNCDAMLSNAESLGVGFRAHIKTHKTLEGVRLQLGSSNHGKIIVSTLMEAYSCLPLVEEGLVHDILYGLPVAPSKIPELAELATMMPYLRLMMDSEAQLDALIAHSRARPDTKKWSVFVKVDCGTHRAGLPTNSSALQSLISYLLAPEVSQFVDIYGFYCHAGHSYHDTSTGSAKETLFAEITSADAAAKYALSVLKSEDTSRFVISVGATPTAHASHAVKKAELPAVSGALELHAGCYGFCDLQQYATNLIEFEDISIRVLAEVVSQYDERDEMLINAGCIALSRETGPIPGYGNVCGSATGWTVGRISQEHGILTRCDKSATMTPVGQKVLIVPQHACITGASYEWYYIVEESGLNAKVVDVWIRFNGW
ncbi:D-serine dehydratase [Taphrina deformans PYCC 5710]|uniref:D-serine dehydratase n=1 Tax=Taphrina deformans (strain PYCC 5710 / ATCC 11124 / CBS 356.35 / IMI 108563 / JCM 9778 / NBRC 8474) TaxID=1097556 RepID=R4XDB6_TAPDE|nr:D-serine dehydratase [Taphrina deformans PYCC 5710]|eukprot:CCG82398.1 D-serine dehydratase [Taphrina deformans PYCC 5710]